MGLFDSTCAATALSLNPFTTVACIPLRRRDDGSFAPRGGAVLGAQDFVGGIGSATPAPPFALCNATP